jgi:hypothetical protein
MRQDCPRDVDSAKQIRIDQLPPLLVAQLLDSMPSSSASCGVVSWRFIVYRRLTMKIDRASAQTYARWFQALADPVGCAKSDVASELPVRSTIAR